jgi:hypothetical protein
MVPRNNPPNLVMKVFSPTNYRDLCGSHLGQRAAVSLGFWSKLQARGSGMGIITN